MPLPATIERPRTRPRRSIKVARRGRAIQRPISMATYAPTGVAGDHVTVFGSVTAAGGASQASLEYGTTTAYGRQTPVTEVVPTANQQLISFPISGLAPGTTYHARIMIVNQAGTVSRNELMFTTA